MWIEKAPCLPSEENRALWNELFFAAALCRLIVNGRNGRGQRAWKEAVHRTAYRILSLRTVRRVRRIFWQYRIAGGVRVGNYEPRDCGGDCVRCEKQAAAVKGVEARVVRIMGWRTGHRLRCGQSICRGMVYKIVGGRARKMRVWYALRDGRQHGRNLRNRDAVYDGSTAATHEAVTSDGKVQRRLAFRAGRNAGMVQIILAQRIGADRFAGTMKLAGITFQYRRILTLPLYSGALWQHRFHMQRRGKGYPCLNVLSRAYSAIKLLAAVRRAGSVRQAEGLSSVRGRQGGHPRAFHRRGGG